MKKLSLFITLVLFIISGTYSQCTDCSGTSVSGINPSAIGTNTVAQGHSAFASGFGSQATAFYTTAIGFYSFANYTKAISIGSMVKSNTYKGVVIGSGGEYTSGKYLENSIGNSMMIGFNSQYPTLFVSESPESLLYNKTGKIGIGNITNPQAKLHLLADEKEEAAILIEPFDWDSREPATLFLGNKQNSIVTAKGKGMFFISEGN